MFKSAMSKPITFFRDLSWILFIYLVSLNILHVYETKILTKAGDVTKDVASVINLYEEK